MAQRNDVHATGIYMQRLLLSLFGVRVRVETSRPLAEPWQSLSHEEEDVRSYQDFSSRYNGFGRTPRNYLILLFFVSQKIRVYLIDNNVIFQNFHLNWNLLFSTR